MSEVDQLGEDRVSEADAEEWVAKIRSGRAASAGWRPPPNWKRPHDWRLPRETDEE